MKLEAEVFYLELIVDKSIAICGTLLVFTVKSNVQLSMFLTPKLGRAPEELTKGFSRTKLALLSFFYSCYLCFITYS